MVNLFSLQILTSKNEKLLFFSTSKVNLMYVIVYLKEIFKPNRYPNGFIDLCIQKFFDKLCNQKKIYQTVEKKQLLIILLFLGHLSFETRNKLNSCIRNQLPSC